MDKTESRYEEDICFICSYGWQRIEDCRECLFNVLKQQWIENKKKGS